VGIKPGTHMIHFSVERAFVLEDSTPKIEDKQVLGTCYEEIGDVTYQLVFAR